MTGAAFEALNIPDYVAASTSPEAKAAALTVYYASVGRCIPAKEDAEGTGRFIQTVIRPLNGDPYVNMGDEAVLNGIHGAIHDQLEAMRAGLDSK